jgi:hypothetical protein
MSAPVLERLRALLQAEGGLIATLVEDAPARVPDGRERARPGDSAGAADRSSPAALAAAGPRAAGRREDYELLVEAIYEGYLLHYGRGRVVCAADADLGLLAGDRLYAIGLARLVALGDTPAVAELADTITLSSLAQGAGAGELAEAVWTAGARAVGWGASPRHQRAKELVLAGSQEALEAMRTYAAGPPTSPDGAPR